MIDPVSGAGSWSPPAPPAARPPAFEPAEIPAGAPPEPPLLGAPGPPAGVADVLARYRSALEEAEPRAPRAEHWA